MSEWKPIETLEPEEDKNYLVLDEDGIPYIANALIGDRGPYSWSINCKCYEGSDCFPIYWMPLPEFPHKREETETIDKRNNCAKSNL